MKQHSHHTQVCRAVHGLHWAAQKLAGVVGAAGELSAPVLRLGWLGSVSRRVPVRHRAGAPSACTPAGGRAVTAPSLLTIVTTDC